MVFEKALKKVAYSVQWLSSKWKNSIFETKKLIWNDHNFFVNLPVTHLIWYIPTNRTRQFEIHFTEYLKPIKTFT